MNRNQQRLELNWYNKDLALIPTEQGKYGYTWIHPSDPRYCETRPLVMDEYVHGAQSEKAENLDYSEIAELEPQGENLLIQGESGDVLKSLTRVPELAEKYVGQIKCIYIDPPFNTGDIFTNYEDNLEHSIWLTMMRDRLQHMHRLLSDGGSIWVHLDDSEIHRMRLLLDKTFGPGNYLGTVIWQKADGPRNDLPNFSVDHDSIVVYGKSPAAALNKSLRDEALNEIYKNVDGDPLPWYDDNPTAPSAHRNQTWVYGIQNPLDGEWMYPANGRCWGARQETVFKALNEYAPYELVDLDDAERRAKICGVPVSEVRTGIKGMKLAVPLEEAQQSFKKRRAEGMWPEFIFRPKGTLGRKRYQPDGGHEYQDPLAK